MVLMACSGLISAQEKGNIPEILNPPASEVLLLTAHAMGDQVYTCDASAWKLKEPDAKLFDAGGKQIGRHFAGPSWEASDGSVVKGKLVASALSPDADAIPWLLVAAVEHAGNGVMSGVTSIQRVNTKNGKPGDEGCDPAHTGATTRSHYEADYRFYQKAK